MQLCLSKDVARCLICSGNLVVLAAKGKTLRTALRKKADIVPSPAGNGGIDASSRALKTVLASLEDSKAENIVSIDLQGKSTLGDHMVVASGRSHRHVAAVAEHLLKALKDAGDDAILDAMAANPILIERALVETERGVRLGRPPERVREIL